MRRRSSRVRIGDGRSHTASSTRSCAWMTSPSARMAARVIRLRSCAHYQASHRRRAPPAHRHASEAPRTVPTTSDERSQGDRRGARVREARARETAAMKEVRSKGPLVHHRAQVAMRRRHDPYVDRSLARLAEPADRPRLEGPQQLNLHRERQLSELIEEQGPTVCSHQRRPGHGRRPCRRRGQRRRVPRRRAPVRTHRS